MRQVRNIRNHRNAFAMPAVVEMLEMRTLLSGVLAATEAGGDSGSDYSDTSSWDTTGDSQIDAYVGDEQASDPGDSGAAETNVQAGDQTGEVGVDPTYGPDMGGGGVTDPTTQPTNDTQPTTEPTYNDTNYNNSDTNYYEDNNYYYNYTDTYYYDSYHATEVVCVPGPAPVHQGGDGRGQGGAVVPTMPGHAIVTAPGGGAEPLVKVFDAANGQETYEFLAYDAGFRGAVRVAVGDVTGDGVADIVTATGAGGVPLVEVFDGATGDLVGNFWAYNADYRGGVEIAVADLHGDGMKEIITATDAGGQPLVNVFDATGKLEMNFYAYDANYMGGVHIGAGDFGGTGHAEIVTATAGGGLPLVNVFNWSGQLEGNFYGAALNYRAGFTVAAGDVAGMGREQVVLGNDVGAGPEVRVWDLATRTELEDFYAAAPGQTNGLRVAAVDGDVVTVPGPGGLPVVTVLDGTGKVMREFLAYGQGVRGGVFVAGE